LELLRAENELNSLGLVGLGTATAHQGDEGQEQNANAKELPRKLSEPSLVVGRAAAGDNRAPCVPDFCNLIPTSEQYESFHSNDFSTVHALPIRKLGREE
jgi:hypothetical protein